MEEERCIPVDDNAYERFTENIESGMSEEDATLVEEWARKFIHIKTYTDEDGNEIKANRQKREMLFNDTSLTAEEKEMIDRELIMGDGKNAKPADYSSSTMFELWNTSASGYANVKTYVQNGIAEDVALKVEKYRQARLMEGSVKKDDYVKYMKSIGMSTEQINIVLAEANKNWKPIE